MQRTLEWTSARASEREESARGTVATPLGGTRIWTAAPGELRKQIPTVMNPTHLHEENSRLQSAASFPHSLTLGRPGRALARRGRTQRTPCFRSRLPLSNLQRTNKPSNFPHLPVLEQFPAI